MAWQYASSGALSPKRLATVRRDVKVLNLHLQGLTFAAIAKRTGFAGPSGAQRALIRALGRCTHPDRAMLIQFEQLRLEALHAAMHAELAREPGPRREAQLITHMLAVVDLHALLVDNCRVGFRGYRRRSPARPTGTWTDSLQQRADGASFEQIAEACGLSDRSAAKKRLTRELNDYAGEATMNYRTRLAARYDKLQYLLWDAATAEKPSLQAVAGICKVIERRIHLLGLIPPEHEGPPPNPLAAILTYVDDIDPRTGLAWKH
jgi:AraC-like DNA-binding protein